MKFGEKLRQERANAGLTQEALSSQLGVTCRTLQNYESGAVYPKKRELYTKLSEFFDTDLNYWLSESPVNREVSQNDASQVLADHIRDFFSQSDLTEEQMDDFMRIVQNAYWEAKDKNKHAQR